MDTVSNVVWIFALLIVGRISKKVPHSSLLKLCTMLHIASFIVLTFTTPENGKVMYLLFKLIQVLSASGNAVSINNIIFDIVDREHQTNALSLSGMIIGLISFFTTIAINPFFEYLQENMPTIFGTQLYAQQMLSIITTALLVIVLILWYTIGSRLTVKHSDKEE